MSVYRKTVAFFHKSSVKTAIGCLLIGLACTWVALLAFGSDNKTVGPFQFELKAQLGRGHTKVMLPPFDYMVAPTHWGPLSITATLENADSEKLADDVDVHGSNNVVRSLEKEPKGLIPFFALRLIIVSLAVTAAVALLTFRRQWRKVLLCLTSSALVIGGSISLALVTYSPAVFRTATFHGQLRQAPEIIGSIQTAFDRVHDFRPVIDNTIKTYLALQDVPARTTAVLHISDLHLNWLGMQFAQELAKNFNVAFVIDTGDTGSFGTKEEGRFIASYVPGFKRPYVFVRGNHDAPSTQAAIAVQPNAIVLDGKAATVDGITVYGLGDPAFTPDQENPVTSKDLAKLVRSVGPKLKQDVLSLSTKPDIVAVHDERMAESIAGSASLVISGHLHKAAFRIDQKTIFCRVGTTGGDGLVALSGTNETPYSAQILYFSQSSPHELVAYDLVEGQPGVTAVKSVKIERHVVKDKINSGTVLSTSPTNQ